MEQKPVIQYVGQFYVYGSEVQAPKKLPKQAVAMPRRKEARERKVYVDPVAVCGIVAAVVILVVLLAGAIQLRGAMQTYQEQAQVLAEVKRENARLEHRYRTALDLEQVRSRAEALGMVSAEKVQHRNIRVSVPEAAETPSAWDNFIWFVSNLLGELDESQVNEVFTDWEDPVQE